MIEAHSQALVSNTDQGMRIRGRERRRVAELCQHCLEMGEGGWERTHEGLGKNWSPGTLETLNDC